MGFNTTPLRTADHVATLRSRLDYQREELRTCTTPAMVACVLQAIRDTERQLSAALFG